MTSQKYSYRFTTEIAIYFVGNGHIKIGREGTGDECVAITTILTSQIVGFVAPTKGLITWAELSRFAELSRLSELTFELRLHAPR
jgi:hypothetical protein